MEKVFVLKSATPEMMGNGRVAVYPTLDRNVNMILILKEGFEWENRKKEECWRCKRCNCYIYPADKSKVKDGMRYHQICTFRKEVTNAVDLQCPGTSTAPVLG